MYKKNILLPILLCTIIIINTNNIYANEKETSIDTLIENIKTQNYLKAELDKLQNEMSDKDEEHKDMEIVTVSFIEDNEIEQYNDINQENSLIEDKISNLEKQLEESMIEKIKIQKILKQSQQEYLKENNLKFMPIVWPVPSYTEISSSYGNRIHPITKQNDFHRGIDIPAPQDIEIIAVDDGVVTFSGTQGGYGNVVKIKHFDGKQTVYAHNNLNEVKIGDVVKKGQVVAKIGSTGNSTGNHLHFETIFNEEVLNPLDVLN